MWLAINWSALAKSPPELRSNIAMKTLTFRVTSLTLAATIAASLFAGTRDETKASVSPAKALVALKEGNARFSKGESTHPHGGQARRMEVAKGQRPIAAILGCADSRLSPELVFDQGLGDLFVTRVAGNTYGKVILGSIEYSVAVLGCRLIVILGHENCGAVDAAIKGGKLPGSIPAVIELIKPAVRATKGVKEGRLVKTVAENVRLQVKKMAQDSKILRDLIKKGELRIVGATYDLDTGQVKWLL